MVEKIKLESDFDQVLKSHKRQQLFFTGVGFFWGIFSGLLLGFAFSSITLFVFNLIS